MYPLQFRLFHNKTFCNDVLFLWKKTDSQQCNICEKENKQLYICYLCVYIQGDCAWITLKFVI